MSELNTREKIKRLIIQPMIDRGWTGPEIGKLGAVTDDYIRLLGKYPEPVLSRAFDKVLGEHKWNNWPKVASFVAACDEIYTAPQAKDGRPSDYDRIDRSRKAWAYVDARMAANDHELLNRCFKHICWKEMREFLFRRACEDLRAGRQPHISHAEVDEEIARVS